MPRCPGQDTRNLKISYHRCPSCGYSVEFFSDELEARCPQCKASVNKEQMPSCIQWCQEARKCIGSDRYDTIMDQMKKQASETSGDEGK